MLETDKIKEQLKKRLEALGSRIEDITEELRSTPNPDAEDRATEAEGDEVLEGLENSALAEITQIQAALERIENGIYGACATCGGPIGEKRLRAVPYAVQCIDCAGGKPTTES